MSDDPTDDRRKYPRLRTDAVISIMRVDEDPRLAEALDLSRGGIRFRCIGLELELDSLIRVNLRFGRQDATVLGKLVRITDLDPLMQEFALAFVEVDAATLELIEEELPELQDL